MGVKGLGRLLWQTVVVVVLCLTFSSCGPEPIRQGTIHYDITYENEDHTIMFPSEMTFTFKDHKSKATLDKVLVTISMIFDGKKKEVVELSKMLHEKHYSILDSTVTNSIYEDDIELAFEYTGEESIIADHKCEKVIVSRKDNPKLPTYEVYYTKDIGMDHPNWSGPYKSIPGVLLKFRTSIHGIGMTLEASSVDKEHIDDSEFEIPEDYEVLDFKEMGDRIENIIPF